MNKEQKNQKENEALHIEEEELKQQAKDFTDKWMPKSEKYCEVCGAINCKNNDSCIECDIQF